MESQESKIESQSPIKLGLLLLGSFCIAHVGASLLHELGHTVAAILTGGHSRGIMIHPFNFSYSYSNSIHHPLIHTATGALGSSLIAMVLFIVLIRWARPVLMPLLLIGPISLMDNGIYWAWDIITGARCDACNLAQGGISPWLLLFAGVGLCLVGIILTICLMRAIGFNNESFRHRLIILSIGLGAYSLVGIFWNWYSGIEILWYSGLVFVFVFASIAGFFKTQEIRQYEISRAVVASVVTIGIGIVAALLVMEAFKKPAFSSSLVKTTTTRPDDFPDVLVPHRLAFDTSYIINTFPVKQRKGYILSYSLPEESEPNEVRNDLTQFIKEKGYVQNFYWLDQPQKPINDTWVEDTDQVGLKTIQSRAYEQQWIKLTPKVERLLMTAYYVWQGNAFQNAGIIMIAAEISDIDEVLWYVDMHPEGFDWFEVEQLRLKAIFRKTEPKKMIELCR